MRGPSSLPLTYLLTYLLTGGQLREHRRACHLLTYLLTYLQAGNYASTVEPAGIESRGRDGLDRARTHPKFLHSNATSHKWPLGAMAELLDNAFDEQRTSQHGVQIHIDVKVSGPGGQIHAWVHTCIHAWIRTYMHGYMHTCMHAYIKGERRWWADAHRPRQWWGDGPRGSPQNDVFRRLKLLELADRQVHACIRAYVHTCIHTSQARRARG